MPVESLVLSFAVPVEDRKKAFSSNMETAAIIALADANRKKPMVIDVFPEKILFISKLHYPLWVIPWENRSFLVDGLQIESSSLSHMILPDMEPFLNNIDRGKGDRAQFFNALSQHERTFASFPETQDIEFSGIITGKPLLTEIEKYIEERTATKADSPKNIVLIPPKLDSEGAEKSLQEFLRLYDSLQSDIKGLEYASNILNQSVRLHQEKINREIELSNKAFNREIEAIRPSVEKNIEKLRSEHDAKAERMNQRARTHLNAKLREKERLQREFQTLELRRTELRKRLGIRRNVRDKTGTTRLEQSLRSCESQLEEGKMRLENSLREIELAQRQSLEEARVLRFQYQALIDFERSKIIEIETNREVKATTKKNEEARLRSVTARITGQIEHMIEERRLHLSELEELTIDWQPEKATLLALPFYLTAYFAVDKQRYDVIAPFNVQSPEGIVKEIKKKLLSFSLPARIQLLLQPRAKAFDKMFDSCLKSTHDDQALNDKLAELGKANNILNQPNLREALTTGAKELKTEGWMKQEEGTKLVRDYAKD